MFSARLLSRAVQKQVMCIEQEFYLQDAQN